MCPSPCQYPSISDRRQWSTYGYVSRAFDIKISLSHDILTKTGVYALLMMMLEILVPKSAGSGRHDMIINDLNFDLI